MPIVQPARWVRYSSTLALGVRLMTALQVLQVRHKERHCRVTKYFPIMPVITTLLSYRVYEWLGSRARGSLYT